MNEVIKKLKPEEALSRFKKRQNSLLEQVESSLIRPAARYGFVMQNLGFLIAKNTLSEIVINTSIYPIPNTKSWMRGLINVRGTLVPVFDFSLLLGFSKQSAEQENLLVLGKGSDSVGLLIDGLPKACDMTNWKKMVCMPQQLENFEEHINCAYTDKDIIWMDFNQKEYFRSIKNKIAL